MKIRTHWIVLAALLAVGAGMVARAVDAEPEWTAIGPVEDFPLDQATYVEAYRVYVVRKTDGVKALSPRCTHRGCTVDWKAGEFICPCHRARFAADGAVLAGPARDPLESVPAKMEDGQVWLAP